MIEVAAPLQAIAQTATIHGHNNKTAQTAGDNHQVTIS